MAPNTDRRQNSFPYLKYPIYRDNDPKTTEAWLQGKRILDGAEGLWRVHDSLYDLTELISVHPGGSQWIISTKGTDITEAFETHHLNEVAEKLLPNYFVKKADSPRNSPFTFEDEGFYKTLKSKIQTRLKELPKSIRKRSDYVIDSLLLVLLITCPLCSWLWTKNYFLGGCATILVGYILSSLTIAAHNYFHRADNWRMYLFNISGMSYKDWRISHALSHHLHTNTLNDLELSMLEPFLNYFPQNDKPIWAQLASFYYPVIFMFVMLGSLIKDAIVVLQTNGKTLTWVHLIQFFLPTWMIICSSLPLLWTIILWLSINILASYFFMIFGLTAGHHSHQNFFDGDIPRDAFMDWGVHQLDTLMERIDSKDSHFKSLTRFGYHTLHHMFPTLDHAELPYFYPILIEHCEKFELELRRSSYMNSFISHSKQLIRKRPNNFRKSKDYLQ